MSTTTKLTHSKPFSFSHAEFCTCFTGYCTHLITPDGFDIITILDHADGGVISNPCVILDSIPPGHVLIKGYSENFGIADDLERVGIVGKSLRSVPVGHGSATLHKLNLDKFQPYDNTQLD